MGNPAGTLELDDQNTYSDMLSSKWYATITPIEGLNITATLGANVLNQRQNCAE